MELKGKVVGGEFGKGSKSEHNAIFLDTGKEKYRLKMKGGNPFYDATLRKLVGRNISVEGDLTDHFFEITHHTEE